MNPGESSQKPYQRRYRWSNGKLAEYLAVITAASSLLVVFEEQIPAPPFGLDWGDFHLTLGLMLLVAMPVHFYTRRRACKALAQQPRADK
ncbi:MAG: hypothetical protein WC891_03195 [Actinomycetota bacterium]